MRNLRASELDAVTDFDVSRTPAFLRPVPGRTLMQILSELPQRMESDQYAARRWRYRTRYYHYLTAAGSDVEVRTVAVRTTRVGQLLAKEVVRASVDTDRVWVRDLAYCGMSGYVTDWSAEGCGYPKAWNYQERRGIWCYAEYSRRGLFRLDAEVFNPEMLKETERFRYCAWTEDSGDILKYLKLYVEHPRIELLSKIGLGRFANMSGLVKQMERDKDFMRFVSRNIEPIKTGHLKADVIRKAYRLGISLEQAGKIISARKIFGRGGLPEGVDPLRATEYVSAQRGMTAWDYRQYVANCQTLGMDLSDTRVAFPRGGHRRFAEIRRRCEDLRVRENRAERKKAAAALRAAAERFARLEQVTAGGYAALIPRASREFVAEGRALHHCVGEGGYDLKMARGETLIVFIRAADAPEKPLVTAEIQLTSFKVVQCYGDHNTRPPDEAAGFAALLAGEAARIARRETRKRNNTRGKQQPRRAA